MLFLGHQLQLSCVTNSTIPLYIAFNNLHKAFDLVMTVPASKEDCLPPSKSVQHCDFLPQQRERHGQLQWLLPRAFEIQSRMEQGCVLKPTLFCIFFSLLLEYAFRESMCLHEVMGKFLTLHT